MARTVTRQCPCAREVYVKGCIDKSQACLSNCLNDDMLEKTCTGRGVAKGGGGFRTPPPPNAVTVGTIKQLSAK